ncbi:MAG: DUF433 domain-containing protein [Rhodocyclaceae bacterium]|nr:DUF433 domain-containing protein [Rhodocyclaceae bacterium]
MNWKDHIVATPDTLVGKPRIKDTRISVQLIITCLADGWSFEQVVEAYPRITREGILAALTFAAELLDEEQGIAARKVNA